MQIDQAEQPECELTLRTGYKGLASFRTEEGQHRCVRVI